MLRLLVPPSPWRDRHGLYVNREPHKPLFVTALVYLNPEWPEDWDAETLFLDPKTGTALCVCVDAHTFVSVHMCGMRACTTHV